MVRALCGAEDFREYARRVAFVILSGNADAHVKNWALLYPDGLHPRLSPLYDVVGTVAYPSLAKTLALGFVEPEDPNHTPGVPLASIGYADFRAMASRAGESPEEIERDVRAFVERARLAWAEVRDEAPDFVREAVTRHLADVALG